MRAVSLRAPSSQVDLLAAKYARAHLLTNISVKVESI